MSPTDSAQPVSTSNSLIWKLKRREEVAWERMVSLYTPLIYYWCQRSQLDAEESADVTQDVFRTVAQSIEKFQRETEGSTFRGWLRTLFKSRAVDYIRKKSGEPGARGGSEALNWIENVPDCETRETDPATQSLYCRVLDLIQSEFSETAWQAFWQTTVDERPAKETAAKLGMTPGAVRQVKYRILRRVREELGDVD